MTKSFDIEKGPPGHCYRNSWKWAIDNTTKDSPERIKIIQGTVYSVTEAKRINHGWVEVDDYVVDPTQGVKMKRDDYYNVARAMPERAYTVEQYSVNMVDIGVHPPWTAEEVGHNYTSLSRLSRPRKASYRPSGGGLQHSKPQHIIKRTR